MPESLEPEKKPEAGKPEIGGLDKPAVIPASIQPGKPATGNPDGSIAVKKKPWEYRKENRGGRPRENPPDSQLYRWKCYRWDDPDDLPPLEIDGDGYARPPYPIHSRIRKRLKPNKKKVRFLMAYNYSGGNISYSCQEAGITRKDLAQWCEAQKFKDKMEEILDEVADRLCHRILMCTGMIRKPEGMEINASLLIHFLKRIRPNMIPEPEENAKPKSDERKPQHSIPRPSWPAAEVENGTTPGDKQ